MIKTACDDNSPRMIAVVQQQAAANGWVQLSLAWPDADQIQPGCQLLLDAVSKSTRRVRLPILFAPSKQSLIVLAPPGISTGNRLKARLLRQPAPTRNSIDTAILMRCNQSGLFAAIHQIHTWRRDRQMPKKLLLLASIGAKPAFQLQPSRLLVPGAPPGCSGSIGLLEDWGIAARFCTAPAEAKEPSFPDIVPGYFQGRIEQLVQGICRPDHTPPWQVMHWQEPKLLS